jgi:hypothetical protein
MLKKIRRFKVAWKYRITRDILSWLKKSEKRQLGEFLALYEDQDD